MAEYILNGYRSSQVPIPLLHRPQECISLNMDIKLIDKFSAIRVSAQCCRIIAGKGIKPPLKLMNARSHKWGSRVKLGRYYSERGIYSFSEWLIDISKKNQARSELKRDCQAKKKSKSEQTKNLVLAICSWEHPWILQKQKEWELFMNGDYGIRNSGFFFFF